MSKTLTEHEEGYIHIKKNNIIFLMLSLFFTAVQGVLVYAVFDGFPKWLAIFFTVCLIFSFLKLAECYVLEVKQ